MTACRVSLIAAACRPGARRPATLRRRRRRGQGPALVGAGQGPQEGDDPVDLRRGEFPAELRPRHEPDRLGERGDAAIVEVGRGDRDVAQARHPQHLGDLVGDRDEDPDLLEQIAADIDALVARRAADPSEQVVARPLRARDGAGVAAQPAVEAAVRGEEGALEAVDRVDHRLPVGHAAVGGLEHRGEHRVVADRVEDPRPGAAQEFGPRQGELGLLAQARDVAGPAQPEAERRVEGRRRVARNRRAVGGQVPGHRARAAGADVVTGDAGPVASARQPRVGEEQPADGGPVRVRPQGARHRRDHPQGIRGLGGEFGVGRPSCGPRAAPRGRPPRGSPARWRGARATATRPRPGRNRATATASRRSR